jgi:hypothetical protein
VKREREGERGKESGNAEIKLFLVTFFGNILSSLFVPIAWAYYSVFGI